MSTIQIPTELTVEHLLSAVKQLPPAELREFTHQFSEWQKQNGEEDEAVLVTLIQEYSLLPPVEQERYEDLRYKCELTTLTDPELTEYQSLLQRLEARNVKRIEALSALAQRRGTTLREIMAELGLKSEHQRKGGESQAGDTADGAHFLSQLQGQQCQ